MKILVRTENKVAWDRNCETVLHLEISEVVLFPRNISDSDYHHDSKVMYASVHKKSVGK